MSEIPQTRDIVCTNTVESHVMEILNPALHHHDLLQSYVRTPTEIGNDSKQDCEEFKEPIKKAQLNKYPTTKSDHCNGRNDNARYVHDKRKKNNEKEREKEKFDITIESELKIQKSRRK